MNNLESLFCTDEQSKRLTKLGFNEPCFCIRNREKALRFNNLHNPKDRNKSGSLSKNDGASPAILYDQAFRFLRKKFNKESYIRKLNTYYYHINNDESFKGDFNTFEEAQSACIDKLIELAQNEKI